MNELHIKAEAMGISRFRILLADSLHRKCPNGTDTLFWFLIHLAEQAGNGHIRTDLGRIAEEMPEWCMKDEGLTQQISNSLESILKVLSDCGLAGQLEKEDSCADEFPIPRPPLALTADRSFIYFLRRRREEDRLIAMLQQRCQVAKDFTVDPNQSPEEKILQCLDAGKRLIILSGGPGTGKTTTVARLLDLLNKQAVKTGRKESKTILCAPTGRAASQLAENISGHSGRTLHGLLGIYPYGSPSHHPGNPIDADLVVVDEASMVDLPLMNTLLNALSPQCALLLVGDADQLPSVEAGALLGDMLHSVRQSQSGGSPLSGSVILLDKVYRSQQDVLRVANAIRDGDMTAFSRAINGESVSLHPPGSPEEMALILANRYRDEENRNFTALSPLRRGNWGVLRINDMISQHIGNSSAAFHGMPITVTRNDAARSLWNGERAHIEREGTKMRAVFSGSGRRLPLALLPGWEPAWIQTVHKSQGSEFDSIALLLPAEANRLLSREILYTALTRARKSVQIYADEATIRFAVSKKVIRNSRIRQWSGTHV